MHTERFVEKFAEAWELLTKVYFLFQLSCLLVRDPLITEKRIPFEATSLESLHQECPEVENFLSWKWGCFGLIIAFHLKITLLVGYLDHYELFHWVTKIAWRFFIDGKQEHDDMFLSDSLKKDQLKPADLV